MLRSSKGGHGSGLFYSAIPFPSLGTDASGLPYLVAGDVHGYMLVLRGFDFIMKASVKIVLL